MNGDMWQLPDGRKAIEVGRQGSIRLVSIIKPDWPFPAPPAALEVKTLKKLPSRYLHGAVPEEFEEAPF